MKKYIIEAPDETEWIQFIGQTGMGTPNLKMIKASDAVPYEEPDREAIEQEVWEFGKTLTEMTFSEIDEVYRKGKCYWNIFDKYNYQEAKAKYDNWKKDKGKIKVGDELKNICSPQVRICVTNITEDDMICGFAVTDTNFCRIGGDYQNRELKYWEKTGRTFPEIFDLLEKMKEES